MEARKAVFKAKADGDVEKGRRLFESDMEGKRIAYLAALQKLADEQKSRLDAMAADIQRSYESGRNMLLMLGFAAVALGGGFAWYIMRTITQPISDAVRVAESVSSGDLTSDIVVQTRDEAGQLRHALKSMNSNLVDIVGQVRHGADNMADATSEIAAGNLDLSNRTERQASSLQETASSMEQLTSIVRANADYARQATALADAASQTASRGGAVVGQRSAAQRTGIEQVSHAITQMDQTTQQNAALVEQAAAAASAMQEQSEQLAQSVSVFKLTAQQIAAMRTRMQGAGVPALRQPPLAV